MSTGRTPALSLPIVGRPESPSLRLEPRAPRTKTRIGGFL